MDFKQSFCGLKIKVPVPVIQIYIESNHKSIRIMEMCPQIGMQNAKFCITHEHNFVFKRVIIYETFNLKLKLGLA